MTLSEYQKFASRGIIPADQGCPIILGFALGLIGESGEVIDDIKKRVYHKRPIPLEHTAEELGDVLWYVANICTEYGLTLDEIISQNVKKLQNRYPERYIK